MELNYYYWCYTVFAEAISVWLLKLWVTRVRLLGEILVAIDS